MRGVGAAPDERAAASFHALPLLPLTRQPTSVDAGGVESRFDRGDLGVELRLRESTKQRAGGQHAPAAIGNQTAG